MRRFRNVLLCAVSLAMVVLILPAGAISQSKSRKNSSGDAKLVERGKWLTILGGCNDCHSPKNFGPNGPVPDESRLLSGAPAGNPLLPVPDGVIAPDKWGAVATNDLTTWAGPWGVSFAANLTPDNATGLGSWTPEMFIKAIRTGKHMGEGRPILPPMPWAAMAQLSDADLKALFAYLKSLKPIQNAVHDPLPPAGTSPDGNKKY